MDNLRDSWPNHGALSVGDKIHSGPQEGGWAMSSLPSRGSPTRQCGGQNQRWPTNGRILRSPNASMRGTQSTVAHKWTDWLSHGCRLRGPNVSVRGKKSEVAHKWGD